LFIVPTFAVTVVSLSTSHVEFIMPDL